MCGPSSALKAINSTIQDFSNKVTDEAKTVFGDASDVFNTVKKGLDSIVHGGPGQQGFSAAENSARTAEAVESGATMARNLRGAAASGVAAIGGGNVSAPAGSTEQAVLDANAKAAESTSESINKISQENYATGRDNYWQAVGNEEKLPGVFEVANGFNKNAEEAQNSAMKSQQNIDTTSNWWKTDLMNLGMSVAGAATGGVGKALGSWAGKIGGGGGSSMPGFAEQNGDD